MGLSFWLLALLAKTWIWCFALPRPRDARACAIFLGSDAAQEAYFPAVLPAKKPLISDMARSSIGDKSRPTRKAAISAF